VVAPITLTVRAQSGQITGHLSGSASQVTIHAIKLPEGTRYDTLTSVAGDFAFADLPIGRYRVLAEAEAVAAQGLASAGQTVDLAGSPMAEVALALTPGAENRLQGTVLDEKGRPLPFAWVSAVPGGPVQAVSPVGGGWTFTGLGEARTLTAIAPGYYSQAIALTPPAENEPLLVIRLAPRPELTRLAWGAGEILLPPEAQASVEGEQIALDSGWLWGEGGGGQPATIRAAGAVISLESGIFALQNVPGQTAWLYLFEGAADVYRAEAPGQRVRLAGGNMLALPPAGKLVAVPLDPIVTTALAPDTAPALSPVWELTPAAQIRNRLALLGVTTAQAATLVTYVLAVLALVALPVAGLAWWRRRARLVQAP
jgi:hypothetical protein